MEKEIEIRNQLIEKIITVFPDCQHKIMEYYYNYPNQNISSEKI